MDARINLVENQLVTRVAKHMVAMDRIISEST